jgi:trehalose 6-phosphate synthase
MARLVVVSNRVAMPDRPGAASVGGLTMALADALSNSGGLWFGWSGHASTGAARAKVQTRAGVKIATIDLDPVDVGEYYSGYANTVLWPLFHHRIDLTRYERSFDDGYRRVNGRFAEALCDLIEPDDLIWVHDYHLIPLGAELRRRGVKNRIGFFLHVPWPARELLITLPQHRELVRALFDYDLIGFQCKDWLGAFKDYVTREAGGLARSDVLQAFGRTVCTGVFPIGIDASNFRRVATSRGAAQSYLRAAATGVFRAMVVGVDRVDYAKGLEQRFLAFERLLADHPDLIETVSLLQIGQPSRGDVEAYEEIGKRLEAVSGRINGTYATVDWNPIRYINRSYSREHIAGLFRASRIGLVTPLRDGMNLVAKEYVAAQNPDDPGVLVLSRFAGAAEQMREAIIVNPYSLEDVADAIHRGLHMALDERVRRWKALMKGVETEDAHHWRSRFLQDLRSAGPAEQERPNGQHKTAPSRAPMTESLDG